MDSNEFPWISMVSMDCHGFPWCYIDFHRFPWNSVDFHGFPWISMHSHGFPWISMDFHGFPWISSQPPPARTPSLRRRELATACDLPASYSLGPKETHGISRKTHGI